MARRYAPRIRQLVARVARRLPGHVSRAELYSAGCAGLVDAYLRLDASQVDHAEAFVDHRIRGAILDELRGHDTLTRDQRTFARQLAETRTALATRTGRLPDDADVARAMGLSLEQLHAERDAMAAVSARRSAAPLDETTGGHNAVGGVAPDAEAEQHETRAALDTAIATLPPRYQQVLRLHYDEGHSMREIALAMGVTESRVSQIHAEAIGRVRARLGKNA